MKTQSAILMFVAVALIAGIAFDVGRDAIRSGESHSTDVLTISQSTSQRCVGLNVASCNSVQLAVQRSEVGLYALVMAVVVIAAIGLLLAVRSDQRRW